MELPTPIFVALMLLSLARFSHAGGDIIGVTCDGDLTHWDFRTDKWSEPESSDLKLINVVKMDDSGDGDCTLVAIDDRKHVYYKSADDTEWNGPIPGSSGIIDIDVTSTGKLVAINENNKLVADRGLPGNLHWVRVSGKGQGSFRDLTVFNRYIYAVTTNGKVKRRSENLEEDREWETVQSSDSNDLVEVITISVQKNGDWLAVTKDNGLALYDDRMGKFGPEVENSQCVVAVEARDGVIRNA